MKHKLFALASSLSFAALFSQAVAQNTAPIPTNTIQSGTQGPCGNPAQSDPDECDDDDECEDGESSSSNSFSTSVGSSCETNSINS